MTMMIIYLRREDDFFLIFEQWMVEEDKELMDMEKVEEVDEEAEMTMKKRRWRNRPEFP